MKPTEYVINQLKLENARHKTEVSNLRKALELTKLLPSEIANVNDCEHVTYWSWRPGLYIRFKDNDTAKVLKMAGVQGLITKPERMYNGTLQWHWEDGKLSINENIFEFYIGEAQKPETCEIEEVEELPTKPIKLFKVTCRETGEVKTL